MISQHRTEIYGAAILWIMIFHGYLLKVSYKTEIPFLRLIGQFLMNGNIGVEVFLFLSGISLYFSFKKDSHLEHFMKQRLVRLYLPIICIAWVYWILMFAKEGQPIAELLISFTAFRFWIDGNQQIWFVSLMLVLYFLYPYIYSFLYEGEEEKRVWMRTLSLIIIVMGFTLILRSSNKGYYDKIEVALTRFPVFIIGCGFGKIVYEKKKLSGLWWILIAICVVFSFGILSIDVLHGPFRRWSYLLGGIALTFVFAAIFSNLPKMFIKPFTTLGNMSLELYIMHLALKRLYEKKFFPVPFVEGSKKVWFILLIASIVLSWLVYLLEQKILLWEKSKTKRKINSPR